MEGVRHLVGRRTGPDVDTTIHRPGAKARIPAAERFPDIACRSAYAAVGIFRRCGSARTIFTGSSCFFLSLKAASLARCLR